MRFETFSRRAADQRSDCLVIGAFEQGELGTEAAAVDRAMRGRVKTLLSRGDFSGRSGETLLLPEVSGVRSQRLLLVGLGPKAQFNRKAWRRGMNQAITALARTRISSAAIALERPAARELDDYYFGRASAEITGSTLYRINDLKTARRAPLPRLGTVFFGPVSTSATADVRLGLRNGAALSDSGELLRNLGNLPPNVCTPRYLGARARELQSRYRQRVRVRVFDEAAIKRLKMGCFLAVTRGSEEPPRFIVLEYRGGRRGRAPVVLVGKGVTFDTGGISLKDPPAMDEMKYDMCGAATVLAAIDFAARSKLRLNVVGLVPACENMPDGRAIKPGDIVTSASGQTVEILNTDAEGRLLLCDALNYARRYSPDVVVDFATLTGACLVALGNHHSGVMANDDALARELVDAGVRSDDRAWQLPLTEEYAEQLRSNFADMANMAGREGGAITAAAFLGKFTQGMRWAHMDIAGTAWLSGAAKGATGRPLALVSDFLTRRAAG
ncbi:MAG TPA: leucyl aminopeptidase [Steroidobacteraceae bacterium]|jgi:leucyl aminopeptidase|nr:leucyl aminopeptidase [Steroidobacteraceae bacterium]